MTTIAVLKALNDIQQEDLEILSLQEQLNSLYSTMRGYKESINTLGAQKAKMESEVKDMRVRLDLDEVSFKEQQEAVETLRTHLKESRNLKEYHSLNTQISTKAAQMNSAEEEVLKGLEVLEVKNKEFDVIDKKIEELIAKVNESEVSVADEVAELDKAISERQQVRDELAKDIDPELLHEYDRLFKHYEGEAVCDVEDKTCNGCFMALTANNLVMVTTAEEIVRCPSCSRILYNKPVIES